jgi:FKBP-type peptidyl-prolyl cis-trans isomerase FkpA
MRFKTLSLLLLAIVATPMCTADKPVEATPPATTPQTDEEKTLYALGVAMSQKFIGLGFSEEEAALVQSGINDALMGNEFLVDMDVVAPRIDPMLNARVSRMAQLEKTESKAFCDAEAAKPGAVLTESGGIYFETRAGDGPSPTATDGVRLHYHGTLRNGRVFDSSRDENEPVLFEVGSVIPCLAEGLQRMKVGGTARLVCPAESAYADRGAPPFIRPGAAIVFEVELLAIQPPGSTP